MTPTTGTVSGLVTGPPTVSGQRLAVMGTVNEQQPVAPAGAETTTSGRFKSIPIAPLSPKQIPASEPVFKAWCVNHKPFSAPFPCPGGIWAAEYRALMRSNG